MPVEAPLGTAALKRPGIEAYDWWVDRGGRRNGVKV